MSVVKQLGYDAVYCPIDSSAPESLRRDFKKLIKDNGLGLYQALLSCTGAEDQEHSCKRSRVGGWAALCDTGSNAGKGNAGS